MKTKIALMMLLALVLSSCNKTVNEESELLTEKGIVLNTIYSPPEHRTEIEPTIMGTGPIGVGYSGNTGMRISKHVQISEVRVPERHQVLFECEHGQFTVDGRERYYKYKGKQGDSVIINYKERYEVVYDSDGKLLSRTLVGFNYIDAKFIPKNNKIITE